MLCIREKGGEGVYVNGKRKRLRDDEIRRARAATMRRMRESGASAEEIGKFFRLTPRHVRGELKALEEARYAQAS
jgi:hypothetical protein